MAKFNSIDDFKEYELYPVLFENPNKVFPEMEFKKQRGNWISNRHLNGVQDKEKKPSTYIYDNRKFLIIDHATGEKQELINYYMERKACKDRTEAIMKLSEELNLTPPLFDSGKYEENRQTQESKRAALEAFTSALWKDTPEAKRVLDYLHSRDWSDEEIKEAELGLVTTGIINTLPKHDEFCSPVGETHTLAIPFIQGSQLLGFKVRAIGDDQQTQKIGKYRNTIGVPKASTLYSLGIGIKDIVVVEGELDALLANVRVKDIPPVVATTGGALNDTHLNEAIKRGVKRIILLFDNDKAGRNYTLEMKYDNTGKKIAEEGSIPKCELYGIPTYVATLPDDSKDVNDFFIKGHTKEELSELINNALPSYLYRYSLVLNKYEEIYDEREKAQQGKEDGKEPSLTYLERDDFLFEVGEIINNPAIMGNTGNRELVYNELEKVKDSLLLGFEGYREYMNNQYFQKLEEKRLEEIAAKRSEELKQTNEKIKTLLEEGKAEEARNLMETTAETLRLTDKAPQFAKVFTPLSEKEYATLLSEIKEGLPTGYCFKQGKRREALTLNTGLTFICGLPAHGKTSFLNNIAINEVTRQLHIKANGGAPKSVLYFSYEIDKRRLIANLLNTFVNDPDLAEKPLATIYSYYRETTGQAKYFKGQATGKHYSNFVKKQREFLINYLSSGLLTIADEPYPIETLLEAIRYYIKTSPRPVSLICVDYAQLIYSEKSRTKARYEEIKQIVTEIKDFANKEGISFVLAAQFNRSEISCPISVNISSIGEGGDFARIADTCIGIFNLKELRPPKDKDEKRELENLLRTHRYDIEPLVAQTKDENGKPNSIEDYDIFTKNPEPLQGILFVRLIKRRYGDFPLDAFLKWEGKTGFIEQNDKEHFLTTPTQAELFQVEQGEENTKASTSNETSITDEVIDDLPF